MTIKRAAQVLSIRLGERIGPRGVINLIDQGKLGCIDASLPGAKKRRRMVTPDHINSLLLETHIGVKEKAKRSEFKRFASHPRVHC